MKQPNEPEQKKPIAYVIPWVIMAAFMGVMWLVVEVYPC
ncbi:hypothetical protein A7A08_03016 [Methyloligella halotolerans]|uniref:Uncharacterized protein n=1 Tax=Methyloligella halotolerans TaxID=1177755 RepID=A0A1E2RVC2_9HYPH|nr:hypothetical protein A7A08_03016 [Methyloligella halotolerans]